GHADLVGLFVCPGDRLVDAAAEHQQPTPLDVSITVPAGPAGLAGALRQASELAAIRARAVELPVPATELTGWIASLAELAGDGFTVFVELPVNEVSHELADRLAGAGLALKLRTGGTTATAFPADAELATAIEIAVRSGVGFKCTAGLHNAIGHLDPTTGFAHHGFLNVLLAVAAARSGQRPIQALAERSANRLAEHVGGLSPDEVAGLRGQFRSIGSCSITEPLTDLENLGLVDTE
ncbi:MAG: hypothetical protein ABI418_01480, partial [Jatrophihabitantaceae bacterium]